MKLHKGGLTGPVFTCDFCGGTITDAADANATWTPKDGEREGDSIPFRVICKDCDRGRAGGRCWQQLDHFLVYLEHNSNFDRTKAIQGVNGLARLA